MFWDNASSSSAWLTANSHLSISGTNLNVDDDWWDNLDDMTLSHGYIYTGDGSDNPIATSTI